MKIWLEILQKNLLLYFFLFQADIIYFKWWWEEQFDDVKENTKRLIANGQLEFINGGYSQNDEACPYYEDIIDN